MYLCGVTVVLVVFGVRGIRAILKQSVRWVMQSRIRAARHDNMHTMTCGCLTTGTTNFDQEIVAL